MSSNYSSEYTTIIAFVISPTKLSVHKKTYDRNALQNLPVPPFLTDAGCRGSPFVPLHFRAGMATNRKIFAKVKHVNNDGQLFDNRLLREFYQLLWQPLVSWLPNDPHQMVAIVPHDEISTIPFAALLDENGKRLIDKHTITTVPSISLLSHLYSSAPEQQSWKMENRCLVIGNPTMEKIPGIGRLFDLPHAKKEAQMVAKMLITNAICGHLAHKSTVLNMMSQAAIIHIATHGILEIPSWNKTSYIPGALVLARNNDHDTETKSNAAEDCLLSSEEIQQLNLSACELVVLTCCFSGHGTLKSEGLLGLGRAFLLAGAKAVVLSLWEVPDTNSTLKLIEKFYESYLTNNKAAASLRTAMLHLQALGYPEYDWAPYYVLGAG